MLLLEFSNIQEFLIVSLLVFWAGYVLISVFSETAKVPHGAKWVKIPYPTRWFVVPARPEYYKEVANAPEHILSQGQYAQEFLKAKHTIFYDEVKDGLASPLIRGSLTRGLKDYVPLLHEELALAFSRSFRVPDDEWRSFVWMPEALKIIAAMNNRVLVGLPLCRDSEFLEPNINYAVEIILESYALAIVPEFMRPLVHQIFSPLPKRFKKVNGWLRPFIDKYRERRKKGPEARADKEPETVLKWLVDAEEERQKPPLDDAVKRMVNLNFGSIHTTVQTFTHALYSLLSRPEFIAPLRAEVDHCVQEHGWTKEAIDKMKLVDGFIKESLRFDLSIGIVNGGRIAAQDTTLSGVTIPKGTLVCSNVVDAHFDASTYGATVNEFDPYRYIKYEEEKGCRLSIVSTSVNATTFGHGRHACPGRFFAAQEQKLLMAYMLHGYDMKLDSVDGRRPKNTWVGMVCVPSRNAKVLLKRRASKGEENRR